MCGSQTPQYSEDIEVHRPMHGLQTVISTGIAISICMHLPAVQSRVKSKVDNSSDVLVAGCAKVWNV
jgi:hypothetical protein